MRMLSVLSMGTGEIGPSPSPRLDVRFDSKDVLNARRRQKAAILNSTDSILAHLPYMPPPGLFNPRPPRMKREATLPKTFFTKKGDLFLYSEDLTSHKPFVRQKTDGGSEKKLNISTADLSMAIARYEKSQGKYNRFYREGPEIKPGHSARRHAAAWHLSHPEVNIYGSFGSKMFRKPDKQGRKQRIVRSSLSVFPHPYNMPKSLAQIKEGVKPEVTGSGSEIVVGAGILKNKNFDSGSSPRSPQRNKTLTPLVRHSIKIPHSEEKSNKNVNFYSRSPPFEQERDSMSSASSGVKFTRTRLPPIFKYPSPDGSHAKKSINSSSASSNSPRKQVRIQLDPVVLPDPSYSDFNG